MKSLFEYDYKRLLIETINQNEIKEGRNGKTLYNFGPSLMIDLNEGFPIVTGKKIFFHKALTEFKWILNGMTTTKFLKENGIHWWDKFADEKGSLGKTYGYQFRNFAGSEDQLYQLIFDLKTSPNSRRMHVTLWNPKDLKETKLPPCYTGFTFSHYNGFLNMNMHFRSSDMFLGLPYDICVGSLLLHHVASFCDLKPKFLKIDITDAHIYKNHLDQVLEYLDADTYSLPTYSHKYETLMGYKSGKFIKAKLNI